MCNVSIKESQGLFINIRNREACNQIILSYNQIQVKATQLKPPSRGQQLALILLKDNLLEKRKNKTLSDLDAQFVFHF